jgi:ABC-type transport system involved in cytochrome bd biosynthesis fused ATPase/permease subunit
MSLPEQIKIKTEKKKATPDNTSGDESSSFYHRSSFSNDKTTSRKNRGFANIESVTASKGKQILHDMDLWFPEGCITVVLGPSGAGKSTLLQLLTDSLPVNASGSADSE